MLHMGPCVGLSNAPCHELTRDPLCLPGSLWAQGVEGGWVGG